eukprot:jgi/Bigna1/138010/aug1.42_g12718
MSALSLGPLPFVALTLSIPILGAGSSELDDPFVIVDTEMGAVQGRRFDGYNAFLGIPYGESTAGASRFTLPVPKQPWAPKTLNATNFRYAEHLRTPGEGINFLQWIPTVDKEIIPDQPLKLLRAGNFTRMPVIIGSVKNETDAFLPAPTSGPLDALMLDGFLELQFDSNKTLRDAVKKIYPKAMGNGQQRTMRWSTDLLMRCYVKRLADAFVSKK